MSLHRPHHARQVRTVLPLAVTVSMAALLAGCGGSGSGDAASSSPSPSASATSQAPPQETVPTPKGAWNQNFTLTATSDDANSGPVGTAFTRTWTFDPSSCDAAGTCTATVTRAIGATTGEATGTVVDPASAVGGKWTIRHEETFDCVNEDGSVAVAAGLAQVQVISFEFTGPPGGAATAMQGTSVTDATPTPEAVAVGDGCEVGFHAEASFVGTPQ